MYFTPCGSILAILHLISLCPHTVGPCDTCSSYIAIVFRYSPDRVSNSPIVFLSGETTLQQTDCLDHCGCEGVHHWTSITESGFISSENVSSIIIHIYVIL